MKLYQITLPTHDNRGASYAIAAGYFEEHCLEVAGGCTRINDVHGRWRNAEGHEFQDTSDVYQVACEPDQWAELVAYAKRQWADQACLAVATLGDFELV